MKVVKIEERIYKKAEKASKFQGMNTDDFIARALQQGLELLSITRVADYFQPFCICRNRHRPPSMK